MPFATKPSPFIAPNYDIFSPARRHDDRGIVLGAPLDGGNNYTPWIGLSTIRELALKHADRVGLVDAELHQVLEEANKALHRRVRELEAERDAVLAKNDRIAGLAADGYKVVRVQGRPPKKADE